VNLPAAELGIRAVELLMHRMADGGAYEGATVVDAIPLLNFLR
jgi:hypothetical protein